MCELRLKVYKTRSTVVFGSTVFDLGLTCTRVALACLSRVALACCDRGMDDALPVLHSWDAVKTCSSETWPAAHTLLHTIGEPDTNWPCHHRTQQTHSWSNISSEMFFRKFYPHLLEKLFTFILASVHLEERRISTQHNADKKVD